MAGESGGLARLVRSHVWISGRVQGVFFRDSAARQAQGHGVSGWVRNLRDGRVEAVLEGTEDAVEALVRWCHDGPPRATVEAVEVVAEPPEGLAGFEVRG